MEYPQAAQCRPLRPAQSCSCIWGRPKGSSMMPPIDTISALMRAAE